MKSQTYLAVLCLLLVSSQTIDAGFFKGGRRNDLAMLLAGGILTILFQEGAGLVRENMKHSFEGHGMQLPMPGPGPYMPHPMPALPYPMPPPLYMGMLEGYGLPMPLPGMGHMKYNHLPGLMGDGFAFRGLPMAHPAMGHGFPPVMMHHGLGLPLGNRVRAERLEGLKGMRDWNSNGNSNSHGSNNYRPSAEDEEAFRQIFMKLENQAENHQDSQANSGNRGGEFEDSTLGVQYHQTVHED